MKVPPEIIDLINCSGNNFHAKVSRWLTDKGWHVVVSPYYMDQSQSKAREIDLVAEKLWPVKDASGRDAEAIAVRLFIECKFVASPSVFWFAEKDRKSASDLVCTTSPFRSGHTFTEKHHYLSKGREVAKLFSTQNSKTTENEPFYKALNQVLNAMVSMSGQPVTIPSVARSRQRLVATLEYPVVVCSSFDQIYSTQFAVASMPKSIEDNFQLEVRYAYVDRHASQRNDYFLLDFVAFEKLSEFGAAIDEDARAAAFLAGR